MRRYLHGAASALVATALVFAARAAEGHGEHAHGVQGHHHSEGTTIKRSVRDYQAPNVTLVRDDGVHVDFGRELQCLEPVYLDFIFTSCTSVCPVMSQTFSQLQDGLGTARDKVRMISVSIDPEQDTPERLAVYARQFDAGQQWRFYTGTTEASLAVQKAFKVFSRDKMNHPVATFFRPAPSQPWVRIDGFATPEQLLHEYRSVSRK